MKARLVNKLYKFEIPKFDSNTLLALAIASYERFNKVKIDIGKAPEAKLNHILLNYIRHVTVKNYNRSIKAPIFKEDSKEYFYWFKAVNNEIVKIYPFLKDVVGQQIARKGRTIFQTKKQNENNGP